MENKLPIGIEPNTSAHQDIIFKVCKAHGIKSLELTTKHISLMSDCISEYIAQQPQQGASTAGRDENDRCSVYVPCAEDDPRACGSYTSVDGRSLCYVREAKAPVMQTGARWVKAIDDLPGWGQYVKWRHHSGKEIPGQESVQSMIDCGYTSLYGWEWYDESAAANHTLETDLCEANGSIEFLDVQNNRLRNMLSIVCEKAGKGATGVAIENAIVEFFKEINAGKSAGESEAVELTDDDTAFMIDCDLYPTYNGVTIQTENDEGASLTVEDIMRLSDVLRRYAILFKQQKEK